MADVGGVAADHLRSFLERIERLEEEKKALADDIRQVKAEAKGVGFDVKTINHILRLRKRDKAEREEHEALLDIYKAALGMLCDTPLGEAARRRLSEEAKRDENPPDDENQSEDDNSDGGESLSEPAAPPEPEDPTTEEEAAEQGRDAALTGKPVTSNPFRAGDKRRALWDQAWCAASGTDGMEVPDAWRRSKPTKPAENTNEDDQQKDVA